MRRLEALAARNPLEGYKQRMGLLDYVDFVVHISRKKHANSTDLERL